LIALTLLLVSAVPCAHADNLTYSCLGYSAATVEEFVRPGRVLVGTNGNIYVTEFTFYNELQSVTLAEYDPESGVTTRTPLPVTGYYDYPSSLTELPDGTIVVSSMNSFGGKIILVPPEEEPIVALINEMGTGPTTVFYHAGTGKLLGTDSKADELYELVPNNGEPISYTAVLLYAPNVPGEPRRDFGHGIAGDPNDPNVIYANAQYIMKLAWNGTGFERVREYGDFYNMTDIIHVGGSRLLGVKEAGRRVQMLDLDSGEIFPFLEVSGIYCSASLPGLGFRPADSSLWGVGVPSCEPLPPIGYLWRGPMADGVGACGCQSCTVNCGECPPGCGNGICSPLEDCGSCPVDCGTCPEACGDLNCDPDENCQNCPEDCGACPPGCGNGICSATEDCASCPADCGTCSVACGNGVCGLDENCKNCPDDCGACPPGCGNGICSPQESCVSCPLDCGPCPE
jgi:hypothetical protein